MRMLITSNWVAVRGNGHLKMNVAMITSRTAATLVEI